MVTLTDVTTVTYSGDLRADALLFPTLNWNYLLPSRTTLYYTFDMSAISAVTSAGIAGPVTAFNAAQKAATVALMNYVSGVTGIVLEQTASGASADFHFGAGDVSLLNGTGYTLYSANWVHFPGGVVTEYTAEAYIYVDNVEFSADNSNPVSGSFGYEVLLHEIGHALGLGHPFDGKFRLTADQDNCDNTVMSYIHVGAVKSTFQPYDLLALSWIYGGDGLQGSFGFNSTRGQSLAVDQVYAGTPAADTFYAGTGNDAIDGAAGIDTAVYKGNRANFTLVKSATGITLTDAAGFEGTDSLKNLERLKFADASIALDTGLTQSGGQAQLLLGAVLGKDLLATKKALVGVGIDLFDQGYTFQQLSGAIMRLDIWGDLANGGKPGATPTQIANYLLTTVNKAAPDAATLAAAVAALNAEKDAAQGDFLWHLAESAANQVQVGLVGLALTGLEFA